MKILVAEDERVMSRMLKDFLELVGHETHVVENGEEAWKYWQENEIDIIVSDINMPYLNGLELLTRVKKSKPDFPVIIVTGVNIDDIHREKTIKLADGFLVKPFKLQDLLKNIERIT